MGGRARAGPGAPRPSGPRMTMLPERMPTSAVSAWPASAARKPSRIFEQESTKLYSIAQGNPECVKDGEGSTMWRGRLQRRAREVENADKEHAEEEEEEKEGDERSGRTGVGVNKGRPTLRATVF